MNVPLSIPTTFAWSIIVRNGKLPLSAASGIYDTIVTVSYVLIFVAFGETMTAIQWVGISLAIIGIILMAI